MCVTHMSIYIEILWIKFVRIICSILGCGCCECGRPNFLWIVCNLVVLFAILGAYDIAPVETMGYVSALFLANRHLDDIIG